MIRMNSHMILNTMNINHRYFNHIGSAALNRCIDGGAFGKFPSGFIGGVNIGKGSAPTEECSDKTLGLGLKLGGAIAVCDADIFRAEFADLLA